MSSYREEDFLQLSGLQHFARRQWRDNFRTVEGALFYGETRRRTLVPFSAELRETVRAMLDEMHQLYRRGHTPRVRRSKSCNACSLQELCLPTLMKGNDVDNYLRQAMEVEP